MHKYQNGSDRPFPFLPARCRTSSNKKLLVAPGIATSSRDAINSNGQFHSISHHRIDKFGDVPVGASVTHSDGGMPGGISRCSLVLSRVAQSGDDCHDWLVFECPTREPFHTLFVDCLYSFVYIYIYIPLEPLDRMSTI